MTLSTLSEKTNESVSSGDELQTRLTLQPASYFDVEKSRTSSEQCTPVVSVTPATECPEYDPTTYTNPCSPFYKHPSTRPSMDSSSKRSIKVEVRTGDDLEAGLTPAPSASTIRPSSDQGAVKEWSSSRLPSGVACKRGMTTPKPRKCGWLSRLPKRQRLAVKLGIALFIVGAMVAIALGVSVAVHGTVYKSKNQSAPIPS